jgi:formate-dependent phosphoribosylglycinamide formyltransferase (GAR transformylase)
VLLGSGELGREVAIEAMRLGCEVVAVDRYAGAPAMQVADRFAVIDMTDPAALREMLESEMARPCGELIVIPEIEAIATAVLLELEGNGLRVVPTARATQLTMDREGIRRLAAEGRTVILVTHNPEIAAVTPRRIEIRNGKISDNLDVRLAGLDRLAAKAAAAAVPVP